MELDMASPESFAFPDDGSIPNSCLPLLVYRGAVDPEGGDPAKALEELFARNGWTGSWRNGIYDFHHFHSTAHEVLGIADGHVRARFGGDRGRLVELAPGDVVVIPAGVGHKNEESEGILLVIGAYPHGTTVDLCRGKAEERDKVLANIRAVPLPPTDPVKGPGGDLVHVWTTTNRAINDPGAE
jgi:uncharacterized protein YjlB